MGSNRQLEPKRGDRAALYAFIKKTKDTETALLINDKNKIKNLRGQRFSTAFPAPSKNALSPNGRHSGSKTVLVFSFSFAWLVSALHYFGSKFSRQNYLFLRTQPR